MKRILMTILLEALCANVMLATETATPADALTASLPENLATKAAVWASSEYDENYAARFAVDEQVPEANSKQDRQQAWCINRAKAGDRAEFTLEWKDPIEVAEIVFFGRTAQILSECWKGYEVYLDQNPQPVAKGTFQMVHGPQRIEIEKQCVRKIRLKFLNSYGPYNPGASEIAVYSFKPSNEQLAQFPLPPSPPAPPWTEPLALPDFKNNPYQCQIAEQLAVLESLDAPKRCVALRNLSQMRAYSAANRIAGCLKDVQDDVRREAALALARTGNRNHVAALLEALADDNWSVRQAAWISLCNLTGQELPFDGLGSEDKRIAQIRAWRERMAAFSPDKVRHDFAALSSGSTNGLSKERLARALGAMGDPKTLTPLLVEAVKPYAKRDSNDRAERLYVQACIRSLGRLGGSEARQGLIALLDHPQWAVYAADALGDIGGEESALALMSVFPDYAYQLDRADRLPPMTNGNGHDLVKKRDPNDMDVGGGGKIWTPRTAYAILFSLSRIDFTSPAAIQKLRGITPNIIANMPLDYDGVSIYEVEPWEPICGWLLERSGLRQPVVDSAFSALGVNRAVPENLPYRQELLRAANGLRKHTDALCTPFAAKILLCACQSRDDVPLLITLLKHKSHWVRINAAKTLIRMNANEAVGPLCALLAEAKDDADFGFYAYQNAQTVGSRGYEEYNDPSPRFKEAFLRALGKLGHDSCVPLLARYLNNDRNAQEIPYAAAQALADLGTPSALAALKQAEASHPIHNIRLVAREALSQHDVACELKSALEKRNPIPPTPKVNVLTAPIVFIKGPKVPPNMEGWIVSAALQAYNQTDEGPTYRVGSNIFKLDPPAPTGTVTALTQFTDGFVADLRVSYDARKLLFSRREQHSPWWHIFEMNSDGTGVRQLTDGPYHDVQPNFLPDGRIVFSSSRVGARDEYHGYLSTALTVMNADGSDIHVIGFNCGRDCEPVVNTDGRIIFIRLEAFYSLPKLEFILESCLSDGTHHHVLYGPERREFWDKNITGYGSGGGPTHGRHRTVCASQPQPLDGATFLINSFRGPMIVGPGRMQERILRDDLKLAVTTPIPLDANTLLCSAGARPFKAGKKEFDFWAPVQHGLYKMDVKTGDLTLIHNDPENSEFEARPLAPRPVPPILATTTTTRQDAYTGEIFCSSIYNSQEPDVKERGKYVRIVEGMPMVARHGTGINGGQGWMNHGGLIARILGLVPVTPDGAFFIKLPADRNFHIQILDSDGYVVGNELNWHYVRPAETVGCMGCHEKPNSSAAAQRGIPSTVPIPPIRCLPVGGEMIYRAKNWKKWLDDENEERKRTVNSMNILGRL